jgi:hypothetical protein
LAALRQDGHYFTTITALQDKGLKNIGKTLVPDTGRQLAMHRRGARLPQRITAYAVRR